MVIHSFKIMFFKELELDSNQMIRKTTHLFVLLTLTVTPNYNYIMRDPECRYHANYTRIEREKRWIAQRKVSFQGLQLKDCTLKCTMDEECVWLNHNHLIGACELIQTHGGYLQKGNGWTFVSTDYTMDSKYIGWYDCF